ncbi:uncharacterized protein LOC123272982 isoform X1 [Cotesia glomerata]|uniref:uncharacterized protein LOC123272982 isoform X1 n=1 Tax=Cotesia glomerata TaxID=32391 RepID=UPI001D025D17|nr:uncharacterized protein LOC123272982 isoform X1 [Cotesia glomerata]
MGRTDKNDIYFSDHKNTNVDASSSYGKDSSEVQHLVEPHSSVLSDLQLRSTEAGLITETPDYENLSTSAVLHYCKCKILRPYLRLLAVMGLKPTNSDSDHFSRYCVLSNFHTFQVTIFMCIGYILQYMACFRRDRGFCYKLLPVKYEVIENINRAQAYEQICYGNAIFSYLIPSTLHLVAYLYTVYLFRIQENEQLPNLMERAFLLSSNSVNRGNQKKLVRILWFFIGLSVVWMTMALITVNIMMAQGTIRFQWLDKSPKQLKEISKVFLIICTLWHDMVQGTIITSYCLQGQLLVAHLSFLKVRLLENTLPATDWMKEILEFKKLLKYFNDDLGPAVCIYTVVNLSWAAAGTAWLLQYDSVDTKENLVPYVSIVNVILWIMISVVPFIQAARLTTACSMMQSIGHEVRVRPFVYQGTPGEDLDSILLYTSSLKMNARMFRVPITGRYLCLFLTIGAIIVITLGQCHFFS